MGDTDALRDKIAQAAMPALHDVRVQIKNLYRDCACGVVAQVVADAVLPVVTVHVQALGMAHIALGNDLTMARCRAEDAEQALSLLRSRVEALADELDDEVQAIINMDAGALGRRGALRDAAQRLRRSLSDNKEQQ